MPDGFRGWPSLQAGRRKRSNPAAEVFQRRIPASASQRGRVFVAEEKKSEMRQQSVGSFFSTAQTNGCAVSLRDYKKASVEEEKFVFPIQASSAQYEWNIEMEHQLVVH